MTIHHGPRVGTLAELFDMLPDQVLPLGFVLLFGLGDLIVYTRTRCLAQSLVD